MSETPKQYSARRIRVAVERAKVAVMDAQQELADFRGNATAYQQLLDAALSRLDCAWALAAERERREKARREERALAE